MKRNIGVVGFGKVGNAISEFFQESFKVHVYDRYLENYNSDEHKSRVKTADLAIVCVPTPYSDKYGYADLEAIEEAVSWLEPEIILLKSTVPPGTTERLSLEFNKKIVFSPEYIGESSYVTQWWKDVGYIHPNDIKKHDFFIFGGPETDTSLVLEYFKSVAGPIPKYLQTDSTTAELVKYMENSWASTKVTFVNQFYNLANSIGVNFNELRELWLLDGRINRMHTAVFSDSKGFKGKCLPKDLDTLIAYCEKNSFDSDFFKMLRELNLEQIRTNDEKGNDF